MTIGINAICHTNYHGCDTFDYIVCRRKEEKFWSPEEHNLKLDWCRKFERECGKPAADAYCKSKGYSYASSYPKTQSPDELTMTIGDHAVCNPQFHGCDTFNYIVCRM